MIYGANLGLAPQTPAVVRRRSRVASAVMLLGVLGSTACAISHPYGTDPESSKNGLAKKRDNGTSSDAAPVIAKIDPPSVGASASPTDLTVTVSGTGFTDSSQLAIDGSAIPTTFASNTQLKGTIPGNKLKSAGAVSLAVVGGDGSAPQSNPVSLVVFDPSASALSDLKPTSTQAKTAADTSQLGLDVTGNAFDSASVVVFNGTDLKTSLLSPTALHAAVPSNLLTNPGVVNVSVKGGSHVTSPLSFTISSPGGGSTGPAPICDGALTCSDVGLALGECVTLGDGSVAQCEDDGCLYQGCL
jgi:hypothetical protein